MFSIFLIVTLHKYLKHPYGYERVYLLRYNVADTPFHIQVDESTYFHELQFRVMKSENQACYKQKFILFSSVQWSSQE